MLRNLDARDPQRDVIETLAGIDRFDEIETFDEYERHHRITEPSAMSLGRHLALALVLHLVLVWLGLNLWHSQSERFALALRTKEPKSGTEPIEAYFISASQISVSQSSDSQSSGRRDDALQRDLAVAEENLPTVPQKPQSLLAPTERLAADPMSVTKMETKPEPRPAAGSVSEPAKQADNGRGDAKTMTVKAPDPAPEAGAAELGFSMGSLTQGYLQRQREAALDDLVQEQADKFTLKGSMSEMTPDMEVLIVPNADDMSQVSSLDLPLDPHRVVKKGNTCYRVVNVGTQINPHAWNLGYPFDCSGRKMNQDIADAIDARMDRMLLKRR
jgi:hypothetical protein